MINLKDKLKNLGKSWVKENLILTIVVSSAFASLLGYGTGEFYGAQVGAYNERKNEERKQQEDYKDFWEEISGYADSDKNGIVSFEEKVGLYKKMEIFSENKRVKMYGETEFPKPTIGDLQRGIFNYVNEKQKKSIKKWEPTGDWWTQETNKN